MHTNLTLINTIAAGLGLALILGFICARVKLPALVGYLLAGVIIGPYTPGFVADTEIASQLAEIGVMLLMFGVGLHFSLDDLLSVRKIALPGAVVQMVVATLMGMAMASWWGWAIGPALVLGISLSVASTVVLLRALESLGILGSITGRIAVGWLVVEDLAMVLVLVLLPPLAGFLGGHPPDSSGAESVGTALGLTLLRVGGFVALMLLVGRKLFPWLLWQVTRTGSRELFTLCVVAAALGIAFASAELFGVSFALGAFFAGMVLRESEFSHRAAEESLPLRDAFAVLFFVSVGMLFDPKVLVEQPLPLIATVAIIVFGKSFAAYAIVRAFGHPNQTAMTIAVSLAQIGEFSFILAGLGVGLKVMPPEARDLILAGSILSILFNPILFTLMVRRIRAEDAPEAGPETSEAPVGAGMVLIGYGRVGSHIGSLICGRGAGLVVIEDQKDMAAAAETAGATVIVGDATKESVLRKAGLDTARTLLVAIPEGAEAGAIVRRARAINPKLVIVARAHSDEEVDDLVRRGADHVVMAERETAARMAERAMLAGA